MKNFLLVLLIVLISGCTSTSNSDAFISNTEGRYLFNTDETIDVYFTNKELFLNWRGATDIKPMPLGNESFFVKEMNEKILFKRNPEDSTLYMCLVPKHDEDTLKFNYRKLTEKEQIPSFYVKQGDFENAKLAYLKLQANDSLDPNLSEVNFNRLGYKYLREKEYDNAIGIFGINIALYPKSANVYDSMGDALLRKGDTLNGVEFYRKAYSINSDNPRAKKIIEEFSKKN